MHQNEVIACSQRNTPAKPCESITVCHCDSRQALAEAEAEAETKRMGRVVFRLLLGASTVANKVNQKESLGVFYLAGCTFRARALIPTYIMTVVTA